MQLHPSPCLLGMGVIEAGARMARVQRLDPIGPTIVGKSPPRILNA
jgi:hypothetical protein